MSKFDLTSLKEWFQKEKRDLPWRTSPTPYQVLVSEIMLQQTQVSVVIPYYERWMQLFPDFRTLAKSNIETVLKAWEGLGYYSRAKNLHKAANIIVENWGGELPKNWNIKIPGIGP